MADPGSRPEFDRAWELLTPRVKEVVEDPGTDDAAVVATLLRFAAQLHIRTMLEKGHAPATGKELFVSLSELCFEQTVADYRRLKEMQ